jgi:ankyrin repeat protein
MELLSDINIKTRSGLTLLGIATWLNDIDIIKSLIKNGADVNMTTNYGWELYKYIPINYINTKFKNMKKFSIYKLLENDRTTISEVIRELNNLDISESFNYTPLMIASQRGNIEAVKLLANDYSLNFKSSSGFTALMLSASNNHIDVIKFLLEKGANVNEQTLGGGTALTIGIRNIEIVKLLLKHGANVNIKLHMTGENAVTMAFRYGNLEILNELNKYGAKSNKSVALYYACLGGHLNIVKSLLSRNESININIKGPAECTPLYIASLKGYLEIVRFLLEKGAIVDKQNEYGETPLLIAVKNGHIEVIQLLLEKGVNVNIQEYRFGDTALMLAVKNGYVEVVELLIKYGADINYRTKYGVSAIYLALKYNYTEVVQLLLNNKAYINHLSSSMKNLCI